MACFDIIPTVTHEHGSNSKECGSLSYLKENQREERTHHDHRIAFVDQLDCL